jgi:MFS family permease
MPEPPVAPATVDGSIDTVASPVARPVRARIAVSIAFASNGLLFGAWAPRIPEIKHSLGLNSADLGLALLAPAVGSIIAIRLIGRWSARYGTAPVTRLSALACFGLAWLPGLAPNLATLWLALLAWGATVGSMDVAMNAQGVTVEASYGRPVLSGFHAAWSIGTFVGAVIGGFGAGLHVPISAQQAVVGSVLAVAGLITGRWFIPDPAPSAEAVLRAASPSRHRWRRPERRLVLLGIAGVFALVSEGAVADWSGVLLRDHLHVSAGEVGYGFAAFSIAMTAGRLAGDRVVHRFGRRRSVGTLSVIGAVGLGAGLAIDSTPWVIAGFAVLGIGLSVIVPVLFSSAADGAVASGPAIAVVASFGYTGFLIGPTVIGLVAQGVSVQFALRLLPVFTLAAGALGLLAIGRTPPREPRS